MEVEVFVDLICPHSYIAVRRLDAALAEFEDRADVEVIWRSFQLDTRRERSFEQILVESVMRNHRMSRAEAMDVAVHVQATLTDAAAREGLAYHPVTADPVNTFDAHRMLHLAAEHGVCDAAVKRIQQAYFAEGMAIGDPETLAMLVAGVGVDLDEARSVALGDDYSSDVLDDRTRRREPRRRRCPLLPLRRAIRGVGRAIGAMAAGGDAALLGAAACAPVTVSSHQSRARRSSIIPSRARTSKRG
ncbi:MAG TPA: DsbA family protein [Solirubrobacteraceae bacterium]|nr:DsbA family protein [Solirubrobacteraceae bacterium]